MPANPTKEEEPIMSDKPTTEARKPERDAKGRFIYYPQGGTSTYKPEYDALMLDYFTNYEQYRDMSKSSSKEHWVPLAPTMIGFSAYLGVPERTIRQWVSTIPSFAESYERCKNMSRTMIIENALVGDYNGEFSKWLLVNAYDMRDKTEQEVTYTVKLDSDVDEESN